MPKTKLTSYDIDFIMNMKKVKYSNCEIAEKMGITEGTIRYRLKRRQLGIEDGRKSKPSGIDRYKGIIDQWIKDYEDSRRRPTLKVLYEWLKERHGYQGLYDAFRRYVRKHFPEFRKKRAWVRIETPPGTLLLVDWKEDVLVQIGGFGNWIKVNALCFTLGFSRKMVVRFSVKKDLAAFIHCHQEALRQLGGLPEVIRTDCLKSAIVQWRGSESILNDSYKRYIKGLVLEVFPARPGTPEDKGKVEKRIRDLFTRMDFKHHVYKDMADLQDETHRKLTELEQQWRCGATGMSVAESFGYEQETLRPVPDHFPNIPISEKRMKVRRDGTVWFDGNYYQVLRDYIDRSVLCMNTGKEVIVFHDGFEIERFPYLPQANGMVMLSEKAIKDPAVILSDTVRRWGLEVARRQVDIYNDIIQKRSL